MNLDRLGNGPRIRFTCALALALLLPGVTRAQTPPVAAAALAPAPPPPPPVDPHTLFEGPAFAYAGGPRERAGLDTAIDRAIADLFFVIRPIARGRLHDLNPVYSTISVHFANGQIEVLMAGRPIFRSPESGTRVQWTAPDNDHYQLSQRFENGRIVQEIAGPTGVRRNELIITPDGHVLSLRVRITSSQLPAPLAYSLTYRR